MRKIQYLIIITLIFGCDFKKGDTKNKFVKNENLSPKVNNQKKYPHLFLTLNPDMSENLFLQELNKLNLKKEYVIPINNSNIPFKIEKGKDRIRLDFSNIYIKTFENKFSEDAEKRYKKFINSEKSKEHGIKMITAFKEIFYNKYPNQLVDLPLVKNKNNEFVNAPFEIIGDHTCLSLDEFGFNQKNYLIFQDSLKTVLVGFTNSEYVTPITEKTSKFMHYNPNPTKSRGTVGRYDKLREILQSTSDYEFKLKSTRYNEPITKKEGYALEINYMFNEDFGIIKEKIINDFIVFEQRLKFVDSIAEEKNKNIDENLENL